MKISEILEDGLAIIENPEHWIQGTLARTKDGESCSPDAAAAYSFCSIGVLSKVWPEGIASYLLGTDDHQRLARRVLREAMNGSIAWFNDTHSHEVVVAAWRQAIAHAKSLERLTT